MKGFLLLPTTPSTIYAFALADFSQEEREVLIPGCAPVVKKQVALGYLVHASLPHARHGSGLEVVSEVFDFPSNCCFSVVFLVVSFAAKVLAGIELRRVSSGKVAPSWIASAMTCTRSLHTRSILSIRLVMLVGRPSGTAGISPESRGGHFSLRTRSFNKSVECLVFLLIWVSLSRNDWQWRCESISEGSSSLPYAVWTALQYWELYVEP